MEETETLGKFERLHRISYLLYRQPQGLTVAEIARLCGASKRTIQRDLLDLEAEGIPLWDDEASPRRHGIIAGYYLPPVHLTLDDALALFLAARLLARYADSLDPHIVQALAKLARVLPEPMADYVHATIRTLATRPEDAAYVQVLGTLAQGWATGRKVHIWHRAAQSEHVHDYLFCPYFIEPSEVGHATHAIGYASYFEGLHTFKVERISRAELTAEPYTIPADFDGPALLRSAWGVMYGDQTVEVVLRFAPSAARRVQETTWHPSQQVEGCADGGCILRVSVAHPEEMRYWCLGWGAQVEVLAPASLRETVVGEVRRMGEVYAGEEGKR